MRRIEALREQVKIQSLNGNWNYDPYMHGMANGLICALATMEDREPDYLTAPEKWLCDLPPNPTPDLTRASATKTNNKGEEL